VTRPNWLCEPARRVAPIALLSGCRRHKRRERTDAGLFGEEKVPGTFSDVNVISKPLPHDSTLTPSGNAHSFARPAAAGKVRLTHIVYTPPRETHRALSARLKDLFDRTDVFRGTVTIARDPLPRPTAFGQTRTKGKKEPLPCGAGAASP
jgi:hypothetical protein